MIKIDFKEFFRGHIWFGWQCVGIYDGKGQWKCSLWWSRRIIPMTKRDWDIEEYTFNYEMSASSGYHVWDPVIK